ncbi:MAG: hypothetical protein ACE5EL_00780 [Anaerolineae bacterium]
MGINHLTMTWQRFRGRGRSPRRPSRRPRLPVCPRAATLLAAGIVAAGLLAAPVAVLAGLVPMPGHASPGPLLGPKDDVPATVTLTAPQVITAGGSPGLVEVDVQNGAGLAVADGTTVTLTTTLGAVMPVRGPTRAGVFTARLTAGGISGVAHLSARAGAVADETVVVIRPGPAATMTLVAGAISVPVGTAVPLTATVADAFGNATAQGEEVAWRWSAGEVRPTASVVAGGVATTVLESLLAGPVYLTATLAGADLAATEVVTFAPGPPLTLLVEADPWAVGVGDGRATIHLTAVDAFGNPVWRPVTVALEAEWGTVTPATVPLVRGVGRAQYAAPNRVGEDTLTAVAGALATTAEVDVRPADLRLTIGAVSRGGAVPPAQAHPGDPVAVSMVLENRDVATARDVVLAAIVPDALVDRTVDATATIRPRGAAPPGLIEAPPQNHTLMAWDLASVAGGHTVTVTVRGHLNRAYPWAGFDTLFLRAAAQSSTPEATAGDLKRGRLLPVNGADLLVDVELDGEASTLRPGGVAVYDIALGNNQRATELGWVRITETLPAGTTYDHWQPEGTEGLREVSPFSAAARRLVWEFDGDFGPSDGLRLWLNIDDDLPPDSVLENVVAVGSDVFEVHPQDNVSAVGTPLRGVNLSTVLDAPARVVPGGRVAYRLWVRNLAQRDTATAVKVTGRPPAGTRLVSRSAGGTVGGDGSIVWETASIGPGGRTAHSFEVEVPEVAAVGLILTSEAVATSDEDDSYPADNLARALTAVIPGPPARMSLQVPPTGEACSPAALPLAAKVWDAFGNLVADATAVSWSATAGTLEDAVSGTVAGVARTSFLPGAEAGVAQITAVAGDAASAVHIDVRAGGVRALAVTARPRVVAQGGRTTVTANALDGCSRPVADGLAVTLAADRGRFGPMGSSTSLATQGGQVKASLDVGSELGSLRIRATHAGVLGEVVISVVPPDQAPPTPAPKGPRTLYLPLISR